VDAEFQRVALRTVAIGLAIVTIGATLLYFAFRSFAEEKQNSTRPLMMVLIAVGFIAICCVALLVLSFR
jgi:uncharacterized membrane protein YqjE